MTHGAAIATAIIGLLFAMPIGPAKAGEQAGGGRDVNFVTGIRGDQNLRTNIGTVTGVGYVHFQQVILQENVSPVNFIGVGTAKGLGANDCPDRYGGSWGTYIDGRLGGVYFCNELTVDLYHAGDVVNFNMRYGQCVASSPATGWIVHQNGSQVACKISGHDDAPRTGVALETTGTSNVDRNIDVKFEDLEVRRSGSWTGWGNADNYDFAETDYSENSPDDNVNAYKAPLD